jgi:hypothetical protein
VANPLGTPVIDYTARDFETIKAALISNIRTRFPNDWQDFTESNVGIALLELVAYVGDVLNFMIDLVANEQYVTTAQDRSSMIRLCRLIGYELKAPTAAGVNLVATIAAPQVVNIIIEEGTTIAAANGVPFEILDDYIIPIGDTETTVVATEGSPVTDTFSSDGTSFQRIKLNQASDIHNSIEVIVDGDTWTKQESLAFGDGDDKIYIVEHDADGFAFIMFGDGISGAAPALGAVIEANYRVGGGVRGNINVGQIQAVVDGLKQGSFPEEFVSVTLINEERGSGGEEAETVDHARIFAPRSVKTNGRAVTQEDFITLASLFNDPTFGSPAYASARLKQRVPELNTVEVFLWSRDSEGNPIPPSTALKTAVQAYFDNNGAGAVRLICVDTEVKDGVNIYIDFFVEIVVLSDFSSSQVVTDVKASIEELFDSPAIQPGQDIRLSQVYRAVQSTTGVKHALVQRMRASKKDSYSIGTGTGAPQLIVGTTVNDPLENTVRITFGTSVITDDGAGNLVGAGTGTINYTTGAFSVTLTALLAQNIQLEYRYKTNFTRNVEELTFDGVQTTVNAVLGFVPIVPASLAFVVGAGGQVITSNPAGQLLNAALAVIGSIDYETGVYTFTLGAAPVAGTILISTYDQILDSPNEDIPIGRDQLAVLGLTNVTAVQEELTD